MVVVMGVVAPMVVAATWWWRVLAVVCCTNPCILAIMVAVPVPVNVARVSGTAADTKLLCY